MKIHLQAPDGNNIIRNYGPGQVIVNQDVYSASLVVLPDRIIPNWPPRLFGELAAAHFESLAALAPELVILGTGRRLRFPQAALTAPLVQVNIGWEVMDTAAACRTYNILMGEGRNVAAALLMIEN
ncbi:MAG: Mth938-like domain-containing protein [Acidiferrobacterales bacterium]